MKKNLFKTLATVLFSATLLLSGGISAQAATSPETIAIKNAVTTMTVGETVELDSKITPSSAKVSDSKIVWTSSDTSVIKVLEKYDDDTKITAVGTGTATIKVKIKGTSISAKTKITVTNAATTTSSATSTTYAEYKAEISGYKREFKAFYTTLQNTTPAMTYSALRQQIRTLEAELEAIEDKLDAAEDRIKSAYRSGSITKSQYKKLKAQLEAVEDYADTVEDYLERKFGDD